MKYLAFILAFALPLNTYAALSFSTNATDRVSIGTGSSISNLPAGASGFTVMFWVKMKNMAQAATFVSGRPATTGGNNNWSIRGLDANGNLTVRVTRATTALRLDTNDAAGVSTAWSFVAFTVDLTGATMHIYHGRLTSLAVEATYVAPGANNQLGTGAAATDGGTDPAVWGTRINASAYINAPGMDLANGMIYNRSLSLPEIQSLQFFPRCISGCVYYSQFGYNGVGTQADWSGNGNAGTVTTATSSGFHIPLRAPFGY